MSVGILLVACAVMFVWAFQPEITTPARFQAFQALAALNLINIALCLYFLFRLDRDRTFRTGWSILIVFLSVFSMPVFWFLRIRPHYAAATD